MGYWWLFQGELLASATKSMLQVWFCSAPSEAEPQGWQDARQQLRQTYDEVTTRDINADALRRVRTALYPAILLPRSCKTELGPTTYP